MSFRPQILQTTFRTYLQECFRGFLNFRISQPTDWQNMNPFRDVFKDYDRKFSRTPSRTDIFYYTNPVLWTPFSCRVYASKLCLSEIKFANLSFCKFSVHLLSLVGKLQLFQVNSLSVLPNLEFLDLTCQWWGEKNPF